MGTINRLRLSWNNDATLEKYFLTWQVVTFLGWCNTSDVLF
jgi:hypothetical protein